MKKQILLLLISLLSLSGFAQTQTTLPVGAKPYGNQLYIDTQGQIWSGLGSAKFRALDTKQRVDSLLILKSNANILTSGDLSKAQTIGNYIYGLTDQYTGQSVDLIKIIDGTVPVTDNIIYFKPYSTAVYYKRVLPNNTFKVEIFGAKADDGVTDNYLPIKNLANYLNITGGNCTVVFSKGVYFINQYKITTGPGANGITDIRYNNLSGVNFIGNGATISVKGNFNRGKDSGVTSYSNTVNPFYFTSCKNLKISGFELYGNVDKMTRASGVVEAANHGISFYGCSGVLVDNIYTHNWAADGMYIGYATVGSDKVICKYFNVSNVRSENNARQGMSITGLYSANFTSSSFTNTGITGGAYGSHSPSAGVDIEPNFSADNGGDLTTGYITFENCTFKGNAGWQFVSGLPSRNSNIHLNQCLISKVGQEDQSYTFSLTSNASIVENCVIEGDMRMLAGGAGGVIDESITGHLGVTVRNNKFRIFGAQRSGVLLVDNSLRMDFTDNVFSYDSDLPTSNYFPYFQAPLASFNNNRVIYKSSAHPNIVDTAASKAVVTGLFQQLRQCNNNSFELFQVPGKELTNQEFILDFGATKAANNTLSDFLTPGAGNVLYKGKPGIYGNTNISVNTLRVGSYSSGSSSDLGGRTITFKNAPPVSGIWQEGDVILNNQPNAALIGWKCLTASSADGVTTPATWGVIQIQTMGVVTSSNNGTFIPTSNQFLSLAPSTTRTFTANGTTTGEFFGATKILAKSNTIGSVNIVPAAGVTILNYSSILLANQGDYVTLVYVAANTWQVVNLNLAAINALDEKTANKATSLTTPGNLTYPTTLAVSNALTSYLPLAGGNITGSLGIGTSTPSEKLEVVGNAKINGTVTASAATSNLQLATLGQVGFATVKSASGTGAATQITIAHGFSGITSSSTVIVQAKNAASASIQYVTIDATNVYLNYSVAPVTGTNNLLYSIYIKP